MKPDMKPQKAVIYCRSASAANNELDDALAAQAMRCNEFAELNGLAVKHVYSDHGSGLSADRPTMDAMLQFIATSVERTFVIVEDPTRIARDITVNLHLRKAILNAGGVLMCVEPAIPRSAPQSAKFLAAQFSNARQP